MGSTLFMGKVTYKAVADDLGYDYMDPITALSA
jgi:hypothetical protein